MDGQSSALFSRTVSKIAQSCSYPDCAAVTAYYNKLTYSLAESSLFPLFNSGLDLQLPSSST